MYVRRYFGFTIYFILYFVHIYIFFFLSQTCTPFLFESQKSNSTNKKNIIDIIYYKTM